MRKLRGAWPRLGHAPLSENLYLCCSGLPISSRMPNIKCLLLFSSIYLPYALYSTCSLPKIILRMRRAT